MKGYSALVGGYGIYWVEEGEGLPTLLIHGFEHPETAWNMFSDALWSDPKPWERGLRFIAPHLWGFGASQSLSEPASVRGFAEGLAQFLETIRVEQANIIGMSLGGSVALCFAAAYPKKVRRLVIHGPPIDGHDFPAWMRALAPFALKRLEHKALFHRLSRYIVEKNSKALEYIFFACAGKHRGDFLRAMPYAPPLSGEVRPLRLETMAALVWDMLHLNLEDVLEGLCAKPILLVDGETAAWPPVNTLSRLRTLIPHAEYLCIPNAGHLAPYLYPEKFSRAVCDFLKRPLLEN